MRGAVDLAEVAPVLSRVVPELSPPPGVGLRGGAAGLREVDSCRSCRAVRLGFPLLAGGAAAVVKIEDFVPELFPRFVGAGFGAGDELCGSMYRNDSRSAPSCPSAREKKGCCRCCLLATTSPTRWSERA